MPGTQNPSFRGSDDFDAINFVSREAEHKYQTGRPIQPCRWVDFSNFDCDELLARLSQVGWDSLVQNNRPFYPDLIKIFYANASYNKSHSTISSRIRGRDFSITPVLLNTVLNIPRDGVMYYQTNTWNFPNFAEGEVRNRLLCEPSASREDSSKLSFHDRLAHFLLTKLVLPRDGHHTIVQKMDLFLLHHLKEEIQVNLAHIIICHMAAAADHTARSLPYGSLLTAVFQHFNFALERELPKKNTNRIDSSTFTSIGFKKNQYGQWVRKNTRDTPEDQDGTPNGSRFRGFSYSRTRKKDHLSSSRRFFSSDVNYVTTTCEEEVAGGEQEEAGHEDVQQEAPIPSPPPCDPYPMQIDINQRFDRLENQVHQRLNRMDHMLDRMENQWNALFELSSAFYAAYGPRASQPSSSIVTPLEATTSQDKDAQDDDDEH